MNSVIPNDSKIMKQRYRRARVILRGPDGEKMPVKLGCGATQGDVTSPSMFLETYDDPIQYWETQQQAQIDGNLLEVRDPVTGNKINTSLITLADDASRAMGNPLNAQTAEQKILQNDRHFDEGLKREEMSQNNDKKKVLPRFTGRGAQKCMQDIFNWGTDKAKIGNISKKVRYLGAWLTTEKMIQEQKHRKD